jgi:hypothetical protein
VVQQVVLERARFEEIVKFVISAVRDGIPEKEIWATVEVMSSGGFESSIRESEKEIRHAHARKLNTAKEALDWLRS